MKKNKLNDMIKSVSDQLKSEAKESAPRSSKKEHFMRRKQQAKRLWQVANLSW